MTLVNASPLTAPIPLPTASGALGTVSYATPTGTFTAAGSNTATAIALAGANILQEAGGTDTGFDFTPHNLDTATAAFISGTPAQAGVLSLTYTTTDDAPYPSDDILASDSFERSMRLMCLPSLADLGANNLRKVSTKPAPP